MTINTRYTIGNAVVSDGRGNGNNCKTNVVVGTRNLRCIRFGTAGDIVIEITRVETSCPKGGGCEEGEEKKKKFFHDCICLYN